MRNVLLPNDESESHVWTLVGRGAVGGPNYGGLGPNYTPPPPPPAVITPAGRYGRRVRITASVPITAAPSQSLFLLSEDEQRGLLIVQNNSTATSPDVAPNFYIGFGSIAVPGNCVELQPGVGLVLDDACPVDSIYVAVAGGSGSSQKIQGVVLSGRLIW